MVQAAAFLTLAAPCVGPAAATSDPLQLIRETPCAAEYRLWFFSDRRSDLFVAPAAFSQDECARAATLIHSIDEQERRAQVDQARAHAAELTRKGYEQHLAELRAAEQRTKARRKSAGAKEKPGASIGMTPTEVVNETNWGRPTSINRTTTATGTTEQWVYGAGTYLYFRNNRLSGIQQAR